MPRKLTKILSFFLCFLLLFEQSGFAQVAGELDISGHLLQLRNSFLQDKFRPLHLRYLSYDSLNNNFKLLLDKGDFEKTQGLSSKGTVPEAEFKEATKTLLHYFFIGISLPNSTFWVNLRPDSEDNVIDADLAKTDVGRILLEQDLQLKKDTAKATSPETPEGREYWDKLYKKAEELFGQNNITIPTLTRPWIVPGEIIIRETTENAYVYKATLKVMLEEDYLRDSPLRGQSLYSFKDERLKTLNKYSSQLLRELIIPKLTKEINTARRYAPLRQVYYSLILAQWFKSRFYGKGGLYSWLIDRKNLTGLTSQVSWSKTVYFKEYQKSFQQGEYNIKEPIYTPFGQTIRSYMSGGIAFGEQEIGPAITRGALAGGSRKITEIFPKSSSSPIIAASIRGGNAEEPYLGIGIEATEPAIKPPKINKETYSPLVESEKPSALSPVGEGNSGLDRRQVLKGFGLAAIMVALGLWPSLGHGAQKDIDTLIQETADEIGRLQENESQLAKQKLADLLTNQSFIPLKHPDKLYAYYSIGKRLEAKGNIPRAIDVYHFYLWLPVYTRGLYEDEIYYRLDNLYKQAPNYTKKLSLLYHGATSLGAPYHVVSDHHFGVLYGPEKQGVTIVLYDDHHDAFPRGHVFPKGPLTFEWVKENLHIGGWIAPLAEKGSVARLVWIHEGETSEKRTFWQMAFKVAKGILENASPTEQADVYLPVHRIDGISNLDPGADYLEKGKITIHIDLDIFAEAFLDGKVNAKLDALIRQIQTKFKPEQILSIVIATSPSHSSLGANRERINALRDVLIQALVKPPTPPNRPYGVAPVTDEKIREVARFVGLDSKAGNKTVFDAIREAIDADPRINLERVVKDKWPIKTSPSASSPLAEPDERSVSSPMVDGGNLPNSASINEQIDRILVEIQRRTEELKKLRDANNDRYFEARQRYILTDYILRLELLHLLGVLQGTVLYPSMGNDYFPSYFSSTTFGINAPKTIGLGVSTTDTQSLEGEAFRRGLPRKFWIKPKPLQIITANNFATESYFSQILQAGRVDAVMLKGLTRWGDYYYYLVPGGNAGLEDAIRGLLKKIDSKLLKEGGFIVLASKDDLWLADFLINELGYFDLLTKTEYRRIQDILSIEDSEDTYFGDADFVMGAVPIRILQKPKLSTAETSSPINDKKSNMEDASRNTLSIDARQSHKGGIDFRALPIVTQPMPGDLIQGQSPKNILGSVPLGRSENALAGTDPISMSLDAEWQQIENMTQSGLIPSNERIKEYLEVSCQSQDCSQRINKVLSLLADILRLEEERVSSTEPALREMLVLLESDKSAQELQVAISKIEVSPKEPQTIEQ